MWVRTDNGKQKVVVRAFTPYFYVPSPDGKHESIEGNRLKKVICRYPDEVPDVREKYEKHYEANVPFVQRFLIDKDIFEGISFTNTVTVPNGVSSCECDIDYKLCYFDIEVANKGTPITADYVEKAPDPVICVTIYVDGRYVTFVWRPDFDDKYERVSKNWYVVYRNNEKDVLIDFASIVSKLDPDVLIAWNGSDFDIPYMKARLKRYRIKFDWSRFAEFDLMQAYARLVLNKGNKYVSLKEVAIEEKVASESAELEFNLDWWYSDIDKLLKYNMNDVRYMVEIDSRLSLFENARMRRRLSGVLKFGDTFYPSVMLDVACLREARRQNVALPTYSLEKKHRKYEGATVLEPEFGIFKSIAVFDFSRYYPSIMFSFMLDPLIYYRYVRDHDTFDLVEYLKYARDFVKNERTVLLNQLSKFMRMRDEIDAVIAKLEPGSDEYKKYSSMKQAVKGIINSFYGFVGDGSSRLFSMPIAETVTAIGREGVSFVRDYVQKEYGYRTIYGDTDSVMIQVPEFNEELLYSLSAEITEAVNEYFRSKYDVETDIKIKFEKYFSSVFFKAKKRYAYWCTFEDGKECDYIGYRGFETVRGDTSAFIKKLEEEMFEIILKKKPSELVSWLPKKVKEFKEAKLSEIAIAKGIAKDFDKYNPMPAHVKGAVYASTYFNDVILPGRTVYYLYVRSVDGKPRTSVISFSSPDKFDEYADIITVDWDRMIDVSIRKKVEEVFTKFGLPFSLTGKQMTL